MEIVKVKYSDLGMVSSLFDSYRVFYGQKSNPELAFEFLSQRVKNEESVIFLALNENGEGMGFTQLYHGFSSVSAARVWVLNDLYVASKFRNNGVAKQLMNAAKELALVDNVKGLSLETTEDNVNAQKLYESLGYVKEVGSYHYFLTL